MIEIKDLEVKYGDFTAVHGVSLTIEEGEFFTFLGPSGCGKTTTLRAIAGFEQPSQGKVVAFGEDLLKKLPEERGLGFVFQSYALFPTMSVYENIAFGLKAHKVPRREIEGRVQEAARTTGITKHLPKKVSELSGGQQQRVAIARALVLEPKILLMDEPLSNLDAKLRVSTREEIRKLQRKLGITTIYVTHDQEEAMAISDRIAVFNVGGIEQIGTPREIYEHPNTSFVARFIGDINVLEGEGERQAREKLGFQEEYRAYLRPQRLRIARECPQERETLAIPARVESHEFLGAYTKIGVMAEGGGRLSALVFGSDIEFEVGAAVYACCRTKDLLLLKGGGDER